MEQTVGDRIKIILKDWGMTQTEMAHRIGIAVPSLNSIVNGKNGPATTTVSVINREFGIRPEWLLHGTGEMYVSQDKQEVISSFFGKILHDPDDFKLNLICTLAKFNESDWETLRKLCNCIKNSAEAE